MTGKRRRLWAGIPREGRHPVPLAQRSKGSAGRLADERLPAEPPRRSGETFLMFIRILVSYAFSSGLHRVEPHPSAEAEMKISDLVAQLQFLEVHYGDLECVLDIGAEFRSMRHLRVDRLGAAEAGSIAGAGAGDRVSIISISDTPPRSGSVASSRSALRRSPADASFSH